MTDIELEQFITEYGGDIYSFCYCLTGSRQEADDLYQETFLRAIEKKQILDAAAENSLAEEDRRYGGDRK